MDAKQIMAQIESTNKDSFDSFMAQPMIKLMVAMMPAGPEDLLKTLLHTAFNAGASAGMLGLIGATIKNPKKDGG